MNNPLIFPTAEELQSVTAETIPALEIVAMRNALKGIKGKTIAEIIPMIERSDSNVTEFERRTYIACLMLYASQLLEAGA